MRRSNVSVAALAAAVLLQGCANTSYLKEHGQAPEAAVVSAQERMAKAAAGSRGAVDRFSGPKLAGREVRISPTVTPTAKWLQDGFYLTSDTMTLAEVLQNISEGSERRVRVGSMDEEWNDGKKLRQVFPIEWSKGSLAGLLSHIAARMNASWRVSDGEGIEFYQNETRSFQVSLPPGSRTMSSSLTLGSVSTSSTGGSGGGGGGSTGGSGAQSTVSSTLTINTFQAVMDGVKSLVGSEAGEGRKTGSASTQVIGNPELGLITVTGRPALLDRVARHVEAINDRVAQNVFVQIKVMSVSVSKDDYASLGLDGILNRGLNQLKLESPGAKPASNGAPGFLTVSRTGGGMAGSEVVLGLLKQAGEVAIVRSGQVIAANGQPAGVQVADEVNYLAQVSTSVVANAGAQTSLTPGSRTVGFTATVLPMIMADNRLLLQYTLNLSSLLGLTQNSSGGQTIQTPQISSQTLQQQAYVRDGESIVLFGFEQDRKSADNSLGIGGGGSNTSRNRQAIVIVMDVARTGTR